MGFFRRIQKGGLLASTLLAGILAVGGLIGACGSSGSNTTDASSGAATCVPGAQVECACPAGVKGVQTCQPDGKSLGACQCDNMTSTGTSSSTLTGTMASTGTGQSSCGNGNADPGECDLKSEFYCPQDCPDAGGDGGDGGMCANTVYAGMVPDVLAVWGDQNNPNVMGKTSLAAGNAMCDGAAAGSHVCDYEEVVVAAGKNEPNFKAIAKGTTAWMQRTTQVKFMCTTPNCNGQMVVSKAGAGGRCADWTYHTNHANDGEFITFDLPGVPTYHFDNDTTFVDPMASGQQPSTIPGELECNGVTRAILCCYPCN